MGDGDTFTFVEVVMSIIGIGVTLAFGGWAAVVKSTADRMESSMAKAVNELKELRSEIHKDRLVNERRFARLEFLVGLRDNHDESE